MERHKTEHRTQAQRSAATRGAIQQATIECIVDLGLARTSTAEVCKRAGVSRGALLHHYPSKAELVSDAVEQLFIQRHREFRSGHTEALENSASIAAATAALWRIYSGPTLKAWQELVIAARTDPALRSQLQAVNQRFFTEARQTLATLLKRMELSPAELSAATRFTLALLDGLILNQTLEDDEETAQGVLKLLQTVAIRFSGDAQRGGD